MPSVNEAEVVLMRQRIERADRGELLDLLSRLYRCQTDFERDFGATVDINGVGFNAFDGPVLSDIAQRARRYGGLTPRQAELVRRKLVKYAKQLAATEATGS